jgi:hypothetical protein
LDFFDQPTGACTPSVFFEGDGVVILFSEGQIPERWAMATTFLFI